MRIACSVEYNGYGFCGWQKQPKTLTIQGLIEKALFEIAKKDIKTYASGRTDKGVHALGQVFHFDTNDEKWKFPISNNKVNILSTNND